jgi:hypothetical protein
MQSDHLSMRVSLCCEKRKIGFGTVKQKNASSSLMNYDQGNATHPLQPWLAVNVPPLTSV